MKYIYGPVKSRRLGFSLGICLVPYKVCSFDCIYCQLGHTTRKTLQRKEYIKIKDILSELKQFILSPDFKNLHIDYITLSGTGEPLLNLRIGSLIHKIKEMTSTPIALITNAVLLKNKKVREEILEVDTILPSLDTINQEAFAKIDRPNSGIKLEEIMESLIDLRSEFSGKIYLEIMVVKGINDSPDDFKKFKEYIAKLNPDKIHLNTPKRHTSEAGVLVPDKDRLKKIKEILGENCQII